MIAAHNKKPRRNALITGASRGLGRALAFALAEDGWGLILDARGAEALEEVRTALSTATEVIAIHGDVSDGSHRQVLAQAAQQVGGLELLINNASAIGPSPMPELLEYPLDVLEAVFRVNVMAPLGLLQEVKGLLKRGAVIINVTSDAGFEAYPGWGGYGTSKAALEHLTAILAEENPEWRLYWVDPGDMRTQMHQQATPEEDISDLPLPEESLPGFLQLIQGHLPSGRYLAQQITAETA
jgi:NAD(P)-dependent dehydrogenase (short-subunit alcohol dehydrogenase family)